MNLVVILVPAVSDGNKEISDIVENNNVFYKRIVAKCGALVIVGLFGNKISILAFAAVANEFQLYGSFWGNYNEVCEVIELVKSSN